MCPPKHAISTDLVPCIKSQTENMTYSECPFDVPCCLQEWVPIIRQDQISQRKIKAQPPFSDAYLLGMPAKRRKVNV